MCQSFILIEFLPLHWPKSLKIILLPCTSEVIYRIYTLILLNILTFSTRHSKISRIDPRLMAPAKNTHTYQEHLFTGNGSFANKWNFPPYHQQKLPITTHVAILCGNKLIFHTKFPNPSINFKIHHHSKWSWGGFSIGAKLKFLPFGKVWGLYTHIATYLYLLGKCR